MTRRAGLDKEQVTSWRVEPMLAGMATVDGAAGGRPGAL
jgi:hypothetical protein